MATHPGSNAISSFDKESIVIGHHMYKLVYIDSSFTHLCCRCFFALLHAIRNFEAVLEALLFTFLWSSLLAWGHFPTNDGSHKHV